MSGSTSGLVGDLFRRESGKLVATVMRLCGDLDLAEEIVQDTLVSALERWPFSGLPDNPGAWLMTAARHRAIDHLRWQRRTTDAHERIFRESDAAAAEPELAPASGDDRLRLIFLCCHPVLPRESQVALTLRMVGGLTTDEIARGFLAAEPAIAQRIVRAKKTLREQRVPYVAPAAAELAERLPPVIEVVYLIFNEAYTARQGESLERRELGEEALRLAATLAELMPREPEALGLAALLELQASRSDARTDESGRIVLLAEQDRSRWDRARIARGLALLARAEALDGTGPHALQAAIAACHARASAFADTDWRRVASIYDRLLEIAPSPVIELNRAVAVGLAEGPARGLALVDALGDPPALRGYHLLPATRADFLRQLGRSDEAAAAYAQALALAENQRERDFLEARLAECHAARSASR